MEKNTYIFCGAAILMTAAAIAFGQSQQSQDQSPNSARQSAISRYIAPMTPADKAKSSKAYRLAKSADAALDAGDYVAAEANARKSISIEFGSSLAQQVLAAALYGQGKTDEALKEYKAIVDEHGYYAHILLPYALLLLKTGHYAEAVNAYNLAVPTLGDILPRPKEGGPHGKRLMEIYSNFTPDDYQPKDLEVAIHIAMGNEPGITSWLGKGSRDDNALAQFKQAVDLEPNSALAHLYYAAQLKDMRQGAKATAEFKKAAELGSGTVKTMAEKAGR